jgi:hypothetical protein
MLDAERINIKAAALNVSPAAISRQRGIVCLDIEG